MVTTDMRSGRWRDGRSRTTARPPVALPSARTAWAMTASVELLAQGGGLGSGRGRLGHGTGKWEDGLKEAGRKRAGGGRLCGRAQAAARAGGRTRIRACSLPPDRLQTGFQKKEQI